MEKMVAYASPAAFVAAQSGWRLTLVKSLRAAIRREAGACEETIKWGNLIWLDGGPVVGIRAERARVLLFYWRGKRLRGIEPRLKPGGKFELATIELREGMKIAPATVRALTRAALELHHASGPTRRAR